MSNKVGELLLGHDLRKTLILTRLELEFIWQADVKSPLGIQLPGLKTHTQIQTVKKENKAH